MKSALIEACLRSSMCKPIMIFGIMTVVLLFGFVCSGGLGFFLL